MEVATSSAATSEPRQKVGDLQERYRRLSRLAGDQPRFADPVGVGLSFEALERTLDAHEPSPTRCPEGNDCDVVTCRKAFDCGVFPESGSGRRYIIGWTATVVGLIILFEILMMIALPLIAAGDGEPTGPTNYTALTLMLIGLPLAGLVLTPIIMHHRSGHMRRHLRAVAAAARSLDICFLGKVTLDAQSADAVPVVYPGNLGTTDLMMEGVVDRQLAFAGTFSYLASLAMQSDFGNAVGKVAKLAGRTPEKQSRGFFFVCFHEPCVGIPDLLLTPRRSSELYHIRKTYGQFEIPTRWNRYHLVSADPAFTEGHLMGPLGRLMEEHHDCFVQVVGARFIFWRKPYSPGLTSTLPMNSDWIARTILMAAELRRQLMQSIA